MPCATPPCTCPSTISGLMMRPQSSATTKRSSAHLVRLGIDLDRRDVRRRGRGAEHRIVGLRRGEFLARLGRQPRHVGIDRARHVAEGHRAIRAGDRDASALGDEIGGRGLEQVRGGVEQLLAQALGGKPRGAARQHGAAARIGAGAARDRGAVALQHAHVLDAAAEMLGDHLRERRFQPLAVRRDAERRRDGAGRVDADGRRLGAGVDRHAGRDRDARADAGQLGVARDADAEPFACGARFGLLLPQRRVADPSGTRPRGLRRSRTCPTRCRSRSCAESRPAARDCAGGSPSDRVRASRPPCRPGAPSRRSRPAARRRDKARSAPCRSRPPARGRDSARCGRGRAGSSRPARARARRSRDRSNRRRRRRSPRRAAPACFRRRRAPAPPR